MEANSLKWEESRLYSKILKKTKLLDSQANLKHQVYSLKKRICQIIKLHIEGKKAQ